MRVDVFTIFPELLDGFCSGALLGRARRDGVLDLRIIDLREATTDSRRSVDDAPFGGGAGMVLTPGPVFASVERTDPPRPLYLLGPRGRRFDQSMAEELAGLATTSGGFSLLCGRYEGVDERVSDHLVDGELSIGDFVLAGGEVAAVVVIEAVSRLLPGAMGNDDSAGDESFTSGLLEYPHYTRPAVFRGWEVPDVLRNGDHARIERWRRAMALRRTMDDRPDLITARGGLSEEEQALLVAEGLVPTPPATPDVPGGGGGGSGGAEPDPAPEARPGETPG
jgi:tRNA (guanine37-N1)-methyltransferase